MKLSLILVTLGVTVTVFWAEKGKANHHVKKQFFKTEPTDKRNADTRKTRRFIEKLEITRKERSELMSSPYKSAKRGLYDVKQVSECQDGNKKCPPGTVRCGNAGRCISASWICDGCDDCGDNWDERNCCGEGEKECPAGTVLCGNPRSCISTSWICDGFDDCGDNWDEEHCCGGGTIPTPTPNVPCGWSEWSEWTECNTGCNAGLRHRNRTCLCQDGECEGESTEWEECPDDGCFPEAGSGCGTRVIQGRMHRIVGGENANEGAWPWQAQLFVTGSFVCGGTLVGPRHVISAAHCFPSFDPIYQDASNWRVHLGKQNLNLSVGEGETISAVDRLIIHEMYDDYTSDNDIAMLILTDEQSPSNKINFACLDLDHEKQFDSSSDCFITGWGATSWLGELADELQEANVPIIDRDTCNQPDYYDGELTVNMLCAGFVAGGVDSCQGDSGGPLACSARDCDTDEERWYLVGVTSWGYGCAFPNYPGVYTDVSKYTSWIQDHINSN